MDKDFEVNKIATDKVPDIPQNEKDISYYQDEIQRRLIRYTNIKIQGMGFRNYVPSQTFIPIKPDTAENVPMEPIFCEVKPDPVPEIREEIVDTPDAIIEEIPEEKEIEPKQEEVSLEPEMPELGDAFVGVFTEFSKEVENIPPEEPEEEPRVRMPKARKVTVRKITKKSDAEESSDSTLFDNVDLLDDAAQIEEDLNFGNEEKIIKKFPIAAKEKVDTQDNAKPRVRVVKIESKSEPFEVKPVEAVSSIKNETPVPTPKPIRRRKYLLPTIDLLNEVNKDVLSNGDSLKQEAEENAEKLTSTLKNFGIGVTVTGVTRGPTVTRFEFKPDEGIKISRIVSLTDDLALSLAASAVRMEAPIPGKPAIGIEIPNKKSDTVFIREVLSSPEYRDAKSKLSVAIGKDIDGKTIICDIARMPHLLIAGSTGSGKSVCINTMIMGILFKANPEEVKFIMIDPKVVELGIYNSIPHLLIPVVTEPKKASAALAWAVMDVERRYKLFAENNVRDLASYNKLIDEKPELAGEKKIPQIVIIIDELADLMMVCSQDVEKSIIRLAQKARAAGVHLVIATQRPSVDVITGIIKANIPSRVAFAVASQFDSRTILDTAGAEKLLGRGDMLYHPLGFTKSARLQCAFVSDEEVEHVVEFIKDNNGVPEFDENVTNAIDQAVQQNQKDKPKDGEPSDNEDTDKDMDYILEAAEIAFAQGALSTSSIQRRLKLGYSRAARIVDSLEEMGLLSQSEGSKPRQVLLTKEEWEEIINEK